MLGYIKQLTGNYTYGLWYLATSMVVSAIIIHRIGGYGSPKAPAEKSRFEDEFNSAPESV
jgi:hypothetical protein